MNRDPTIAMTRNLHLNRIEIRNHEEVFLQSSSSIMRRNYGFEDTDFRDMKKSRSHHLQRSDPPDDWVDESWIVDCVCGVNFDDGEEMVNCDECGVWVHTRCSRYVKGDELFTCDKCKIKNHKNDNVETDVEQLLVELPTKTMRMESSYSANEGTLGRQFGLWTKIQMEGRVHVHGIPGGDPGLFRGLSSVFTSELWKCMGYIPKKFNFQYREFPWDEKKEGDDRIEDEDENSVDKGAGVLLSVSNESVMATPMAALIGMRGRDEEGGYDRKVYSEKMNRWEGEDVDARHARNGVMEESTSLWPVVIHSGKRKKEDLGTSKRSKWKEES